MKKRKNLSYYLLQIMRMTLKLFLINWLLLSTVWASNNFGQSLDNPIGTYNWGDISVKKAINKLEEVTPYKFVYVAGDLDLGRKVQLNINNESMREVLTTLFLGTNTVIKQHGIYLSIEAKEADRNTPPPKGILKGTILDENGQPLPGATVYIIEIQNGASTDYNGNFTLNVPPGTYTVEISFVSYQKQQLTKVVIVSGKTTPLTVKLQPETTDIGEVKVTAEYKRETIEALIAVQKASVSTTDGISSDIIKQSGANNVAQALKSVTGVAVKDEKFVIVRGMGERYNNVELNGSSLPSTEAHRRNFSFDLIPSAMVDNIVVAKTFTPDMQGEFTGGTIKVTTLSIPDKKFLTISAGTGFNTLSTGKDFISNQRFKGDYFFGSSQRNWFKDGYMDDYEANNTDRPGATMPYYDYTPTEQQAKVDAQIPNLFPLYHYTGKPTQSYSVTGGIPFKLNNGHTLGLVVGATYRHEEKTEFYYWHEREYNHQADNAPKSTFSTSAAALATLGWKYRNHSINWRNMYNYRFNHVSSARYEYYLQGDNTIDESEDSYKIMYSVQQAMLMQTRLDGKSTFLNDHLDVDWFADFNYMNRYIPDQRQVSGEVTDYAPDGNYVVDWIGRWSSTVFSYNLVEKKSNLGGNVQYKFNLLNNEQKIKTGYWGTFRNVNYEQINLLVDPSALTSASAASTQTGETSLMEKYRTENFLNGNYFYVLSGSLSSGSGGNSSDNYSGPQNIHGIYLMGDFSLIKKLHLTGGARLEHAMMRPTMLYGKELDYGWTDTTKTYTETDILPSVNASFDILPTLKVRASYGKTIVRADYRERSSFEYVDLWENYIVVGLSDGLDNSYCKNYDARLEWYPGPGEIISVGAFYKYFDSPIEMVGNGGATYVDYYAFALNGNYAKTKGIEVNLRKHFGFISPALKRLYASGNATWMDGEISFPSETVNGFQVSGGNRSRLPMGMAPFSGNAGLSWQGQYMGMSVNYAYNSERIVLAGAGDYLDEYEAARASLDAQLKVMLAKEKLELKFNASDLLAQPYIIYRNYTYTDSEDESGVVFGKTAQKYEDGDFIIRKTKKGRSFSMSLTYKF